MVPIRDPLEWYIRSDPSIKNAVCDESHINRLTAYHALISLYGHGFHDSRPGDTCTTTWSYEKNISSGDNVQRTYSKTKNERASKQITPTRSGPGKLIEAERYERTLAPHNYFTVQQ